MCLSLSSIPLFQFSTGVNVQAVTRGLLLNPPIFQPNIDRYLHHNTMHLPPWEPFPYWALKQDEIRLLHICSGNEDLISIELGTVKTPTKQRFWALCYVWGLRRTSPRFSAMGSHSVSREISTMLPMSISATNSRLAWIRQLRGYGSMLFASTGMIKPRSWSEFNPCQRSTADTTVC